MSSIEEMINSSKCFGLAYNKLATECKICEVRTRCEAKCLAIAEVTRFPDPVKVCSTGYEDISHTQEHTSSKVAQFPKVVSQESQPEDLPCETKHTLPKQSSKVEQSVEVPKKKKKKKPTKERSQVEPNYSSDMPQFKHMTIEEVEKFAESRGINPIEFDKYNSPNIRRMRMIMAIKQTYEI